MAVTINPVAGPLTCCAAAVALIGRDGAAGEDIGCIPADPASSGNSDRGLHCVAPSANTLLRRLTRPSVNQLFICSASTGPYSLPSAPIIRYMCTPQLPDTMVDSAAPVKN